MVGRVARWLTISCELGVEGFLFCFYVAMIIGYVGNERGFEGFWVYGF